MTMQTGAAVSVDAIDAALGAATRTLSQDEQRLAVAVFRLLATRHPVTISASRWQPPCPSFSLWHMYQRPARARRRADWERNGHAV